MASPESRLFCRLDHMSASEHEQQRLQALSRLGLLETESIPVFEEATQTAARFLDAPICILGVIDGDRQLFKSAVGLSRIGLMNDLASSRKLPRQDAFCTHVVDSCQALLIRDTTLHPAFANSLLVQRYGIHAYLGVPLNTSDGYCIGTLAIMELTARDFTAKDIEFLELTARWSMSEFERNRLLKTQQLALDQGCVSTILPPPSSPLNCLDLAAISAVKIDLITQMSQELRTPLTSILGMASVLNRGIYGSLTEKQKEYLDIIHHSGQYLLTLVNEILELGALDDHTQSLDLSSVDIEMLCQQAISMLEQAAQRRHQTIQLTVEPRQRTWFLDKGKVRQMLYHLVFNVIQSSSTESNIRLHVSRKHDQLNITIWTSHPWLGDGLSHIELHANQLLPPIAFANPDGTKPNPLPQVERAVNEPNRRKELANRASEPSEQDKESERERSRRSLGLRLSRRLAEAHGGKITIQGSLETGYRYVISLPRLTETDETA